MKKRNRENINDSTELFFEKTNKNIIPFEIDSVSENFQGHGKLLDKVGPHRKRSDQLNHYEQNVTNTRPCISSGDM